MFKPTTYKFFSTLVYNHYGLVYTEKDYFRLDSRLLSLQKKVSIDNEDQLVLDFSKPLTPTYMNYLTEIFTNNETYFFRDIKPFKMLTELVKGFDKNGIKNISIWSCACSTGQEAYSIAMTLSENCPSTTFSINATDISLPVLERAKTGLYSKLEASRGLDEKMISKYFTVDKNGDYKVISHLISKVKFSLFNILKDHYSRETYDIIFCRNVLIYQNAENKMKILNELTKSLKPHGVLVLGSGESIIGMNIPLKLEILDGSMYFVKDSKAGVKAA